MILRCLAGMVLAYAITVAACGNSSDDGLGGPSGAGALCGTNGTNQCGSTRQCDVNLGCVECTGDDQCPASAPFCIHGECEACRTHADCGAAAPACFPGDH